MKLTPRPLAAAAVAALLLCVGTSHAGDEELSVRIVKPRNLSTAIGATQVQILLFMPPGTEVGRVELSVDERPLVTLTAPPWQVNWDAGDGSRGHRLVAVLHTRDGRQVRSVIRTSALTVNEIERVDLVNLYVVVRDQRERYVTGLERDAFRIFENKRKQTITRFAATHKPLRVGIVLDTSATMRGDKLEKAKQAALQFLSILKNDDEGLVVTFANRVEVAQELTTDRQALEAAISSAEWGGGTALYDALWSTSRMLDDFDGRRVLVLLSDGRDEAASGLEPGSLHTLDEAVDQTLRSEVMVFAIALGHNLRKEYIRRWNPHNGLSNLDTSVSVLDVLERMAGETGGRAVLASGAGRLRKAFEEIASDLRHQYSIAYVSDDTRHDGKWRKVDVLTPGQELEVITRKGYYAARENQ
jgi:VWFA-related protein